MTPTDTQHRQQRSDIVIRREEVVDHAAVRDVNLRAFGRAQEAELVDRMRAASGVALSLVATEPAGQLVGGLDGVAGIVRYHAAFAATSAR